jgi:hypothetical protein
VISARASTDRLGCVETQGPAAASGVYFVRMQADGFQKTLRITILQ